MSFNSPWLLWALFAASVPIIIHLVNRWRHRSVPWAAMEFLLRAARETRGTKKLLHYLILALRVMAVAALVTAFARPLLGSFFGWGSSGLNEVLLVLDRSASMDARPDKTSSLRDAIPPLVESTFAQLGHCRLSLLDSATGTVTQIPAPEALADLTVSKTTDGGADIPALLQKAIPYLEESGAGKTCRPLPGSQTPLSGPVCARGWPPFPCPLPSASWPSATGRKATAASESGRLR